MSTLAEEVRTVNWYHTIELPGGIVTPGRWDTRGAVKRVRFPANLAAKRCLDVGTWDGFWAFEMERRGASEVIAIDVNDVVRWDWPELAPPDVVERFRRGKSENEAFSIAHRALGSRVERRDLSVYDLSPREVGTFEFAFLGSLLLHLRDPVRALIAIRSILRGELLVADQISLTLSILRPFSAAADLAGRVEPHWWTPNITALKRFVHAAGYSILAAGGPYRLRPGPGAPRGGGRLLQWLGPPHAWVLARPEV